MKRDEVFERLAPPPDGLSMLRRRLDERPRRLRVVLPMAAALAVAAAIVLILRGRNESVDVAALARDSASPSAIGLGLASPPQASVTLARDQQITSALAAVPTTDRRVSFYWVSSTSWAP